MRGLGQIFKNRHVYSIMAYILLLIAIVVIIMAFIPAKNPYEKVSGDIVVSQLTDASEISETGTSLRISGSSTETVTSAAIAKAFVRNGNESVTVLIENYCEALVEGNENVLAKYTDSVDGIDSLVKTVYSEYVEDITDINCYVMSGMLDKTYITMTTYNVRYKDQDTVLPYVMYCYVCTDASGNLYVSNKEPGEDVSSYNDMMYKNSSITSIAQSVAAEYDNKLSTDSELSSLVAGFSQQ